MKDVEFFVVEDWFVHHGPFEHEHEHRCAEHEQEVGIKVCLQSQSGGDHAIAATVLWQAEERIAI